jgi:hypothetical protein
VGQHTNAAATRRPVQGRERERESESESESESEKESEGERERERERESGREWERVGERASE